MRWRRVADCWKHEPDLKLLSYPIFEWEHQDFFDQFHFYPFRSGIPTWWLRKAFIEEIKEIVHFEAFLPQEGHFSLPLNREIRNNDISYCSNQTRSIWMIFHTIFRRKKESLHAGINKNSSQLSENWQLQQSIISIPCRSDYIWRYFIHSKIIFQYKNVLHWNLW